MLTKVIERVFRRTGIEKCVSPAFFLQILRSTVGMTAENRVWRFDREPCTEGYKQCAMKHGRHILIVSSLVANDFKINRGLDWMKIIRGIRSILDEETMKNNGSDCAVRGEGRQA